MRLLRPWLLATALGLLGALSAGASGFLLKDTRTYEPFAPEMVGRRREPFAVGWKSGAAALADAFAAVCRAQDRLWLLPVYDAGGTANRTVHSGELADELRARGVHAAQAATYEELGEQLASAARAGDTILIMGARDPRLPVFAREMAARTAAVEE